MYDVVAIKGKPLKRDDGCIYCNERFLDGHKLGIYIKYSVYLEVEGQHLHLEVESGNEYIVEKIPINNCPMCGRKLSSK